MYDLILKPVAAFVVVSVLLFLFHIYGPAVAGTVCPTFGDADAERVARCIGFFDILK